jgi:hypothetical protein
MVLAKRVCGQPAAYAPIVLAQVKGGKAHLGVVFLALVGEGATTGTAQLPTGEEATVGVIVVRLNYKHIPTAIGGERDPCIAQVVAHFVASLEACTLVAAYPGNRQFFEPAGESRSRLLDVFGQTPAEAYPQRGDLWYYRCGITQYSKRKA